MSEPNWSEDAPTQFWTSGMPIPRIAEQQAVTAEELGWDGIVFPDSQNLAADCYSILTLAATATDRLGLGVGVTNTFTRHPAVTASAIATVQAISRGRAVLGIGRGDSALAQIGLAPVGLSSFERDVAAIQTYLRGEPVSFDRSAARADGVHGVDQLEVATRPQESRIEWIRPTDGKVPVEIAASGPRVLGIAARHADIVSLNVGADPARVAWAVDRARGAWVASGRSTRPVLSAYVNVVCHPDRDTARRLVTSILSVFARFAVMHGTVTGPADTATMRTLHDVANAYDMTTHSRVGSAQTEALSPEFIDRYAIAGPPAYCIERLNRLRELGVSRFVVFSYSITAERADPTATALAAAQLAHEVLPALRS